MSLFVSIYIMLLLNLCQFFSACITWNLCLCIACTARQTCDDITICSYFRTIFKTNFCKVYLLLSDTDPNYYYVFIQIIQLRFSIYRQDHLFKIYQALNYSFKKGHCDPLSNVFSEQVFKRTHMRKNAVNGEHIPTVSCCCNDGNISRNAARRSRLLQQADMELQ